MFCQPAGVRNARITRTAKIGQNWHDDWQIFWHDEVSQMLPRQRCRYSGTGSTRSASLLATPECVGRTAQEVM